MLCTYRPRAGQADALFALVRAHWPTLRDAGLVTGEPAVVYRATDKRSGELYFIELFSWKDGNASDLAHHTPAVVNAWNAMSATLERMELAQIEQAG
jgi:hypothetical protein